MTKKLWGIGDIMKAGFIGTGSIGAPLASNILDQEKALAVC
jgi:3-hydroxyisobutyrate dehydrogenase-like beta-hydroxyacid dehydrogenase